MSIKRSSTKTHKFTTDVLLDNHLIKFTQDSKLMSQKNREGTTLKPRQKSADHVYCRQCRPIYRSIQRSIVGGHQGDSRSIVGRQSVETRPIQRSIVGRQSVETRTIFGRHSVETWSIVFPDVSRPIQLFVHRYFTDTSPIVRRYFTDVSISNWSTLGRWSVDTWSIVRRQQEYLKEFMWRRWHGEPHRNGCFGRLMKARAIITTHILALY